MKPSVLPALLAVFSLVFITGCIGGPSAQSCSTDLTCFALAAKTCTPSSVTSVQSGITTYLEVKGGTSALCNIYVEIKESPGVLEMQGKSMTCMLPAEQMNFSATITSKDVLMNCKGTLASYLLGLAPAPTGSDIVTPLGLYTVQTSPCTENETATCDIDGCGGAMTCLNGVWTACIKTDSSCGVTPSTQKCSDGTFFGQCSANKPAFCDNNLLVSRCSICGCLAGLTCRNNTCITAPSGGGGGGGGGGGTGPGPSGPGGGGGGGTAPQTCSPGFVWNTTNNSCTFTGCVAAEGTIDVGTCSIEKPRYCTQVNYLGYNCQACGCPNASYVCQGSGLCEIPAPTPTCTGTNLTAAQCSTTKPQYCNTALQLENNCMQCGCDSGLVCNNMSGQCVASFDYENMACLDQKQIVADSTDNIIPNNMTGWDYYGVAQAFNSTANQIKRVRLMVKRVGTPIAVELGIEDALTYEGGAYRASRISPIASVTKNLSDIPFNTPIEVEWIFDTPVSIQPNTAYYIVFRVNQWEYVGKARFYYTSNDVYPGPYYHVAGGDILSTYLRDIYFKTYSC